MYKSGVFACRTQRPSDATVGSQFALAMGIPFSITVIFQNKCCGSPARPFVSSGSFPRLLPMARARLFARTAPTASPFARIELTAPVTIRLTVPSVVSACIPFRTWFEVALQSQLVCLVVGPETNVLDSFD
jgi:hypothetical protein